jgi:DNA-binding transcriptional regulator YbjK
VELKKSTTSEVRRDLYENEGNILNNFCFLSFPFLNLHSQINRNRKMDVDKRMQILQGAFKLFYKYGIRSISMDDICRELCMSKKTMYQYFKNKEELVAKGIEDSTLKESCQYVAVYESHLNPLDALLEVSKITCQLLANINPNFIYDLKKYYPEIYKNYIDHTRTHVFGKIRENMLKGIETGLYRSDLSVDLVSRLYVQKLEDIMDSEFNIPNEKIAISKFFKVMFENHVRGISTTEGVKYFEDRKESLKYKL